MQEAAQVALRDQAGQRAAGCRFQFAIPLAQLRWHPREAQGAVHARLVAEGPVERHARRAGTGHERRHVRGRAGCADPIEAEAIGCREEHVHDGPRSEAQGHGAFAPGNLGHARGPAQAPNERFARGVTGVHRHEVERADDLRAAAHRTGDFDPQHPLEGGERAPHRLDLVLRVVKQAGAAGLPEGGDSAAHGLDGLRAEARQRREASVRCGRLEPGERFDRERFVNLAHLGDAEARNAEHLHQPRRHLLAQLLERARAAGGEQLAPGGVLNCAHPAGLLPF